GFRLNHDGQRTLPWKAVVSERTPHSIRRIDCQVFLRLLEFFQEPVLEDINLVGIRNNPLVHASVADVPDLEHIATSQCPLNAEVPGHYIGLADVLIQSVYP